jgi:hypothetical protein
MRGLTVAFALPTHRLFLPHRNSGSIHLHVPDGNRLAGDNRQIQLQGFPDLFLLALSDIGSDGLGYTLHRFGGHLPTGQELHLGAAVIKGSLLPH